MRADLGFGLGGIGVLVAVYFGVAAVFSAPAGQVVEKLGPGPGMRVAGLVSTAGLLLGAAAPSLAALTAAMVIGGAATAVGQVSANLSIAGAVDDSRRAFAFGIKQAGIPAATLLGGLAVPAFALTVGWRWAWGVGALLALTVAWRVPDARLTGRPRTWIRRRAARVVTGPLVVLSAAGALGAAGANAFGAYLVDSSTTAGLGEGSAGILYAAGSALGLGTRVLIGWAADRASGGRLRWVAAQLAAGAAGFALLATGATAVIAPATILCFVGGWGWPGLFNFAIVSTHSEASAAATGVTQTGVYAGGVAGPLLFGVIAERTSYDAAWMGAAGCALLAAAGILSGRHMLLSAGNKPDETGGFFA